jgi:uncharacterized repeat protein (TIGR03803 family)
MRNHSIRHLFLLGALLAALPTCNAQTFQLLHTFEDNDGVGPGALTMDSAGNLYGSTFAGGTNNCSSPNHGCGTIFEISPAHNGWAFTTVYKFASPSDGWNPASPLTFGPGGLLYGTTVDGGIEGGGGTIFSLRRTCRDPGCNQASWTKTTLYRFGQCDGAGLNGGLVFDKAWNLYGTTIEHCGHTGQVYKLSPPQGSQGTWTMSVLHVFQGAPNDGRWPEGPVVFDQAGNLYGSALAGGQYDFGSVYQLTPAGNSWTASVLHSFNGLDGKDPIGGLIFDRSGDLYGTTYGDTQPSTAFELVPSQGHWSLASQYKCLPEQAEGLAGGLVMDAAGNVYGAGARGGAYGYGAVYKLTPSINGWSYTSMHDFTGGADGAGPNGPLVLDTNGNLYGSATSGGDSNCHSGTGCGTVWMIKPN